MYKGFLGEQKAIRIRLPIKLSERLDGYSTSGSKKASITRALIELGLRQADQMGRPEFMKLVHEVKIKYLKEN